jgi:hypothetical protein
MEQSSKKQKHRKDKPWDNDPTLDKWKIEPFNQGGKAIIRYVGLSDGGKFFCHLVS